MSLLLVLFVGLREVYSPCVIQEKHNYALDLCLESVAKERGGIWRCDILSDSLFRNNKGCNWMWRILRDIWIIVEFLKEVWNAW